MCISLQEATEFDRPIHIIYHNTGGELCGLMLMNVALQGFRTDTFAVFVNGPPLLTFSHHLQDKFCSRQAQLSDLCR